MLFRRRCQPLQLAANILNLNGSFQSQVAVFHLAIRQLWKISKRRETRGFLDGLSHARIEYGRNLIEDDARNLAVGFKTQKPGNLRRGGNRPPPGVYDQNRRRMGGPGQIPGGGIRTKADAVIIPHGAFDHSEITSPGILPQQAPGGFR